MSFKIEKKQIILLTSIVIILLLAGTGLYYFYFHRNKPANETPVTGTPTTTVSQIQETHSPCLAENETVDYTINSRPYTGPADIIIKEKNSGKEIYKFIIDSVWPTYQPVQPRKCNVYVIKQFNFDYKQFKPLPDFRVELWQYQYDGKGVPILTFAGEDEKGQPIIYYTSEFQVDFLEKLIALIEVYSRDIDNFVALIKEIETKKDVFSLEYQDIINKYPNLAGAFALNGWTKDSRYFWGHLSYGANVLGFFRIDTKGWSVKLLPVPKDVLGGDALNVENGYITVHPGNVWIGIAELEEQEKAKRRSQGIGTELYIENLLTGDKQFVASTAEPLWYFKPRWLSDTELEYTLPNGEKKVYNF